MSDSDDPGPLTQQAKRRRFSRSTRVSDPEVASHTSQSPIPIVNADKQLTALITELKAQLKTRRTENQRQASTTELEVSRLRSALSQQHQEFCDLETSLERKRQELEFTKTELCSLGREHESSIAAINSKGKLLEQAAEEIQQLEKLAEDLPGRLRTTSFNSKEATMMTMLRSFHRDILEKYFGADGTRLVVAPDVRPSTDRQLDNDTKVKLARVIHGLRTHKSYGIFASPVTEDIAPGYEEIINQPMDLSIIRQKIESDKYESISDFVSDAKLMFDNCRLYNGIGSKYAAAADLFESQMRLLMERRGLQDW